jgi:hypothetical protein
MVRASCQPDDAALPNVRRHALKLTAAASYHDASIWFPPHQNCPRAVSSGPIAGNPRDLGSWDPRWSRA